MPLKVILPALDGSPHIERVHFPVIFDLHGLFPFDYSRYDNDIIIFMAVCDSYQAAPKCLKGILPPHKSHISYRGPIIKASI